MNATVSPEDLQDIVDRYGEDPATWPASFRSNAQELIDDCVEARAIIEQAKSLRAALRKMGPSAPVCFTDKIVAAALEIDPLDDEELLRDSNG